MKFSALSSLILPPSALILPAMIKASFAAPFSPYSCTKFGNREFWAGEPLRGSGAFAGGSGPGLYVRGIGSGIVPTAVTGSEDYRIYALSTFTKADSTKQLVALGILTADLTDWGSANSVEFPELWSQYCPEFLYLFVSEDGETFTSHALGSIEQGSGPYTSAVVAANAVQDALAGVPRQYLDTLRAAWMNAPLRWQNGLSVGGDPALFCYTRSHRIEWDGTTANAVSIAVPETVIGQVPDVNYHTLVGAGHIQSAARNATGIDYLAINEGGQLHLCSQDVVYTRATDEDNVLELHRIHPSYAHIPLIRYSPDDAGGSGGPNGGGPNGGVQIQEDGLVLVSKNGSSVNPIGGIEHRGLGSVNGKWVALWIDDQSLPQHEARFYLTSFNGIPVDVPKVNGAPQLVFDFAGENVCEGNALWGDTTIAHFNVDHVQIRGVGGRAYAFRRNALTEQEGDATRQTLTVFETLVNPTVADFDNTAGAVVSGADHDTILIGTKDGYLYSYDPATGAITVLHDFGSEILRVLVGCAFYVLTADGLYHSTDNGATWSLITSPDLVAAPSTNYHFCDVARRENGDGTATLALLSTNNTDSKVTLVTISALCAATVTGTTSYPGVVVTVVVTVGDSFYIFTNSSNGTVIIVAANNTQSTILVPQLAGENVTAAVVDGTKIWIGTAGGTLIKLETTTGIATVIGETGHPVSDIAVIGGVIVIVHDDGSGTWHSYDPATGVITEHTLPTVDGEPVDLHVVIVVDGTVLGGGENTILPLVVPVSGGTIGDDGVPDTDTNPPAPAGLWVSAPLNYGVLLDQVLLQIVPFDSDTDVDDYLCYVRVDGEENAPNLLSSYQRLLPRVPCALSTPGRVLRFLILPPDATTSAAFSWLVNEKLPE